MNEHRLIVLPQSEPTKQAKRRDRLIESIETATAVCAKAGDAWALWDVLQNLMYLAASYA